MFLNVCNKWHLQQMRGCVSVAEEWLSILDQLFMWTVGSFVSYVNTEVSKWCVCVQEVTQVELKRATPRIDMAGNETKILFESFLQKRKDTLVCCCVCVCLFSVILCWQNNMNELDCVSNMIESQVGDVLVQASKHNFVLLHQKEWKRGKWTFAIVQFFFYKNSISLINAFSPQLSLRGNYYIYTVSLPIALYDTFVLACQSVYGLYRKLNWSGSWI